MENREICYVIFCLGCVFVILSAVGTGRGIRRLSKDECLKKISGPVEYVFMFEKSLLFFAGLKQFFIISTFKPEI